MPRIRDVLIVPHAHHDVGYTHTPRVILPLHTEAVGEAIRLAATTDPADPAAFRWSFENSRPVVKFLDDATDDELAALRTASGSGRLTVTGGYLNSTQLLGTEELARSYEPVGRLRAAGLDVRVVQHSDINGLSWGTVDAMERACLEVVVMALNPNHGRPPFEQPSAFWWEGPSGARVLAWLSLHYGLAEMWGLLDDQIERFDGNLRPLLEQIEARSDYPFDFVVLHAVDDNGWPTMAAANGVRAWNARYGSEGLRLSTATIGTAMARAQSQVTADSIPTWRGEWADWWAHGHGSTALEVGVSRTARANLRGAEAALALARLEGATRTDTERRTAWRREPVRLRSEAAAGNDVDAAWDDLLLFAEHTWGADESVSEPDSPFTRSHWNAKQAQAYGAYDAARDLLGEGLWRLACEPATDDQDILLFNPAPWTRSGPVEVEARGGPIELTVDNIPGFGLRHVSRPSAPAVSPEPASILESADYRIEVDPSRGGVVGLLDRQLDWQLVDPRSVWPLGAIVVESVDPTVDHPVVRLGREEFVPSNPGPAFARVVATGTSSPLVERAIDRDVISWTVRCPGVIEANCRLSVYRATRAVRLTVALVKPENREPEGVYVCFPFALERPTFLLETAGAVFRADIDQLPDTSRDWYSIQHAVGVTDGAHGVVWTTHEAPLVQAGAIHTGEWARTLDAPRGHLFAWLMNNLYFTNFRAEQGGRMSFTFDLEPRAGSVDADGVRRAGEQAALPIASSPVRRSQSPGRLLEVDGTDLVTTSLALDPDGRSVRLRLEASSLGAPTVRVRWHGARGLRGWRADVFGKRQQELTSDGRSFALSMNPYELVTLVLAPMDDPDDSTGSMGIGPEETV
jgi:hypothetical protein